MDNLALEKDIHSAGLIILGELQVTDNDPVPKEAQSILLLGPDEPNFWEIFKESEVSAALAASIFHYEDHSVDRVKQIIKDNGIEVRY